jgi:hypothetical protein
MKYSINQIKAVLDNKGYEFFTQGCYNINIIAVRSENSQSNEFDDLLYQVYKDEGNNWIIREYACTTDPGKHWLLNPLNVKGTLITIPGQYKKSHKIGYHNRSKGKSKMYVALEQINPMLYIRDNTKDSKLDFSLMIDSTNHIKGNFKTNIHKASSYKLLPFVNKYSAGCTVLQDPTKYNEFINVCKMQKEFMLGDKFSYTLIEEKDFIIV